MTSTGFDPVILSTETLRVSILPYGLTLHSLEVLPPAGSNSPTTDLLIGPADPSHHSHLHSTGRKFFNQSVGRYANRLPAGKTVLPCGATIELAGEKGVTLHGGNVGLDTQVWAVLPLEESKLYAKSELTGEGERALALFFLKSDHGADGFPLQLDIEALLTLSPSRGENSRGTLRVEYRARIVESGLEEEKYGTPVNLTLHTGFVLGDVARDEGGQGGKDHRLWVDSTHSTALDGSMLPTGQAAPSAGGPLDFSQGSCTSSGLSYRTIGSNFPSEGIDDNLIFSPPLSDPSTPRVVLYSPDLKTRLSFKTNQTSVQLYTGNGLNGSGTRKEGHKVGDGRGYDQYDAVFLEFHAPHGACLSEEFAEKAGGDTVLRVGETYENWVEMQVDVLDHVEA